MHYDNKYYPVFKLDSPVTLDVNETTPKNTLLYKFTATDNDSGFQSVVEYALSPLNDYVSISKSDGELKLTKQVDREVVDTLTITITATDSAPSPFEHSTNHTVKITIADANDNPPTLGKQTVTKEIMETTPVDAVVYKVIAGDLDAGKNGLVTYSVVYTNDSNGLFGLRSDTGDLVIQSKSHLSLLVSDRSQWFMVFLMGFLVLIHILCG